MLEKQQLEGPQQCQRAPRSPGVFMTVAQETSFHGLRQIGEHQPFAVRRLIWVLLFLGGAAIFLVQATASIDYYFSWPVSVDVKINYNDSITFPAVTICNSNAFSATNAYRQGYYSIIDEMFGPENAANLDQHNESMTLWELYDRTGHTQNDMIVSCHWNGDRCLQKDFVKVMTDYGRCFTFNSGHGKAPLKEAYKPGAEGGLRVQLNIEQYKYMNSPNNGAGLKILIHNQDDIPLVKDHGLAVPPGSQAFVAVKTIEVKNLEPEYGKCNESAHNNQSTMYTVSRCHIDCKRVYLEQECGCVDIYMNTEQTKTCSLATYQNCMRNAMETFNTKKERCNCPIPCHRLLYEPIISYSSASNFDIDALLRNTNSTNLKNKYVEGREIMQRVNEGIAQENTEITMELNDTVASLNQAFNAMRAETKEVYDTLKNMHGAIQERLNFHLDRGLNAVEYIVRHDFVRGWEVFDERAFQFTTLDFIGLPITLRRTWDKATETMDLNKTQTRQLILFPIVDMVNARLEILNRTAGFLKSVNEAYLTGTPLQTYKLTYNRRYDMSYIHVPLLQIKASRQVHYYNQLIESVDMMVLGLKVLEEVCEELIETGTFNQSQFNYGEDQYLSGGRKFNYRIFLFNSRIIVPPLEEIRNRIEKFESVNLTLHENFEHTLSKVNTLESSLKTFVNGPWQDVVSVSQLSSMYLSNVSMLKTPISETITSKEMKDSLRSVSNYFDEIRLTGTMLQSDVLNLRFALEDAWTIMLTEDSVKEPYRMYHEDCQNFTQHDNNDELYVNIFSYMLRISKEEVRNLSSNEIITRMNCDFHTMDLSTVLGDIRGQFDQIQSSVRLGEYIGETDDLFSEISRQYSEEHQQFITGSRIDSKFYSENFLTLEVFMQELSYEEIIQQKAYDLTQLLSDIGGSMGLFIGGSVLSVFEIFDIFIHRGMRVALNR